jgi:hypothetical protein
MLDRQIEILRRGAEDHHKREIRTPELYDALTFLGSVSGEKELPYAACVILGRKRSPNINPRECPRRLRANRRIRNHTDERNYFRASGGREFHHPFRLRRVAEDFYVLTAIAVSRDDTISQ